MTAAPGPIALPPSDLARRVLPLHEFNEPLYRGHRSRFGPLFFNRRQGRWADPQGTFGTLYAGASALCAFREAFSADIVAGPLGPYVSKSMLEQACLCPIAATCGLRLVDLVTDDALLQLAVDNRICDGLHAVSQRWSRACWEHPSQPDGIYYRSRLAPNQHAVALCDRTEPLLRADCSHNILVQPARLAAILDHFGIALIP
jgi:hypothetical protein